MTERWLEVLEHPEYEVSSAGRLRSNRVEKGRLMRPTVDRKGYLRTKLNRRNRLVHHLVLEAFVGPRPPGTECCHDNGDPADNRIENLRWDTARANAYDRVRHGTHGMMRRQVCPRGHSLTPPNLVPAGSRKGRRDCLACNRAKTLCRNRLQRHGLVVAFEPIAHKYYEAICGLTLGNPYSDGETA